MSLSICVTHGYLFLLLQRALSDGLLQTLLLALFDLLDLVVVVVSLLQLKRLVLQLGPLDLLGLDQRASLALFQRLAPAQLVLLALLLVLVLLLVELLGRLLQQQLVVARDFFELLLLLFLAQLRLFFLLDALLLEHDAPLELLLLHDRALLFDLLLDLLETQLFLLVELLLLLLLLILLLLRLFFPLDLLDPLFLLALFFLLLVFLFGQPVQLLFLFLPLPLLLLHLQLLQLLVSFLLVDLHLVFEFALVLLLHLLFVALADLLHLELVLHQLLDFLLLLLLNLLHFLFLSFDERGCFVLQARPFYRAFFPRALRAVHHFQALSFYVAHHPEGPLVEVIRRPVRVDVWEELFVLFFRIEPQVLLIDAQDVHGFQAPGTESEAGATC